MASLGSSKEFCPECGGPLWPTYYRDLESGAGGRFKKMKHRRWYCQVCDLEWKLHPAG